MSFVEFEVENERLPEMGHQKLTIGAANSCCFLMFHRFNTNYKGITRLLRKHKKPTKEIFDILINNQVENTHEQTRD